MRKNLHQFLIDQGGAARADELLDVVFDGRGRDSEFGRFFLAALLADDPRFKESEDGTWRLAQEHVLDADLSQAPFVVVDLETTGHRPDDEGVTEIGAIRLEGPREVGRFQTLVHPGRPIPSFVTKLTGISDAMVAKAPVIHDVIGEFARFASGAVLVAHNAAFDARLLDHASRRHLGRPLGLPHVCTVRLAQRLLPELRRTSLESLCEHFALTPSQRHRAMADAEMTVELLSRFVSLLQQRGVNNVQGLIEAQGDPELPRRLEVHVAQSDLEELPNTYGVYRLIGREEDPLFIGRSSNVRERVLQYFLGADHGSDRQLALISKTYEVAFTRCGSALEAALLEANEIHRFEPPYNRGDRHLPRGFFVKVSTRANFPRVFVAGRVAPDGALYIGPLKGRAFADDTADLVAAAFRLRTCPGNLKPDPHYEPCPLGPAGRCSSPCNASVDAAAYAEQVDALSRCLRSRFGPRELLANLHVSSGERDYGRFHAAARRLERLAQKSHWLVNALHYLAVAPASPQDGPNAAAGAGAQGLFVAAVIAGRCIGARAVLAADDIDRLLVEVRRAWRGELPPREERPIADASTVLAFWLQDTEIAATETVIDLEENDEASLESARQRLLVLLNAA